MQDTGLDMVSFYNLSVYKNGIWFNDVLNFDVDEQSDTKRHACSQLWSQAMIYPDGNLSLCCGTTMYVSYRDDVPYLGNILKNSISEIWHNARYQKIRKEAFEGVFTDNSVCRDCQIWHNYITEKTLDEDGNSVETNPYEKFIKFK